MKIKILKYDLKRKSEEYKKLVNELTTKNYRCFSALGNLKSIIEPDQVELESEFLYENQFNASGLRVFDWREISSHSGSTYFKDHAIGYYIDHDSKILLDTMRDKKFQCGYCGHQSFEIKEPTYCTKCLGSEYLEEKNLFLTIMMPISAGLDKGKQRLKLHKELPSINKAFKNAQENSKKEREKLEILRRKEKARKLRQEAIEEAEAIKYEKETQALILENNLPIDDLIFYKHKGSWAYGWRNHSQKKMDYQEFRQKCCEIDLPEWQGVRFVDLLSEAQNG